MWRYCGRRCCRHFVTLIITIISCSVLSLPTAVDSLLPRVEERVSKRETEREREGECVCVCEWVAVAASQPTLIPTWVVAETEIALIKCALLLLLLPAAATVAVVAFAMTAFEVLLNCIAIPFITALHTHTHTHWNPFSTLPQRHAWLASLALPLTKLCKQMNYFLLLTGTPVTTFSQRPLRFQVVLIKCHLRHAQRPRYATNCNLLLLQFLLPARSHATSHFS